MYTSACRTCAHGVLLIFLLAFLAIIPITDARPTSSDALFPRADATVIDILSATPAPSTDGGGRGFSPPAVIWIIFTALVGAPLAVAGVRGWRITSGAMIGLALALLLWGAFVNAMPSTGITPDEQASDLILTGLVIGGFCGGFAVAFFRWGPLVSLGLSGVVGGAAVGFLIVMLKQDLLFPIYFINWVPTGLLAFTLEIFVIWKQRMGMIVSTAASGVFLVGLALDLIINKQSGMSRGLRVLIDRNPSHIADFISNGYKPPIVTQVIIGVCLVLIPIVSYAQHRFFPGDFTRRPKDDETGSLSDLERRPRDTIVGVGERKSAYTAGRELWGGKPIGFDWQRLRGQKTGSMTSKYSQESAPRGNGVVPGRPFFLPNMARLSARFF